MKYQINLPNKLYRSEIILEVAGSQLQATETISKDGKRVSSNGVEIDFASVEEAQATAQKAVAQKLSLKNIAAL